MYRIMIIEDDSQIAHELSVLLENQGYATSIWDLKEDIEAYIRKEEPHILLLDINLVNNDGFTLCTQIRHFSDVPIIFVTSRNSEVDELCSMRMGGDDFITKPYNTSILLARIEALLKRAYKQNEAILQHKGVQLDIALSRILYEDKIEELTKNEVRILHYLFKHKGNIVSRDDLIDYLWDSE